MVSLKPPFSATCAFSLRKVSSSVMSASSCWVTWGMETQLRCRNPPDSFLMRDSGFASTGPNFAKSTCGHSRSEEHTSELQSLTNLVCRLLLEKKKIKKILHLYS